MFDCKKLSSVVLFAMACSLPLGAISCKKSADNESEDDDTAAVGGGGGSGGSSTSQDAAVPQVGAIVLQNLGTGDAAASLAEDENKCKQDELGIFGMALGGASHTAPLTAKLLLGNETEDFDGDGDSDCDDLAAAEAQKVNGEGGAGILMHLICGELFTKNSNVVSLAFQETKESGTEAMAISFADFSGAAVGNWTAGNIASYPADIRIWGGETFADMTGMIGMSLTNLNKGSLYIKRLGEPGSQGGSISGRIDFANSSGSTCLSSPSEENCNYQQIKFYGGEGDIVDGPPNSFNIRIFADSKKAPTFLALEGRYRYSDALAARTWGSQTSTNAPNIRQVYFRAVQKDGQIWGRFIFRDAAGAQINTYSLSSPNDLTYFSQTQGFCQNLGSDSPVACSAVTYTDYDSLWDGEDNMENLTASPVDISWDGAPSSQQFCTVQGCLTP